MQHTTHLGPLLGLCPALLVGALLALAHAPACGGDDGGGGADAADAVSDVAESDGDASWEGKSAYHMEIVRSDDATPLVVDRDLTGKERTYMAFGSTHIAPAVSFAVTDDLIAPVTMTLTFNFGIVVPSDDFPIDTTGPGTYAFEPEPPGLELTVGGLAYRTRVDGSTGSVVVTEWSTEAGGVVAGSFAGRVIQDTTNETKRTLDVSGRFHFILPTPEDGQPH